MEDSFKYSLCSNAELDTFIRDRGLWFAPGPASTTADRIAVLQQADRFAQFRFLDLPPELRNRIYYSLLKLKVRKRYSCYPHILQASKQINTEATSVLYGDNNMHVNVYIGVGLIRGVRTYIKRMAINNQNDTSLIEGTGVFECPFGQWPEHILRFRNMIVTTCLEGDLDSRDLVAGNHVLYSLCSFMLHRHRLKRLWIKFQNKSTPGSIEHRDIVGYSHPLSRLGVRSNLIGTGLKGDALRATFQAYRLPGPVQKENLAEVLPKLKREYDLLNRMEVSQDRKLALDHLVTVTQQSVEFVGVDQQKEIIKAHERLEELLTPSALEAATMSYTHKTLAWCHERLQRDLEEVAQLQQARLGSRQDSASPDNPLNVWKIVDSMRSRYGDDVSRWKPGNSLPPKPAVSGDGEKHETKHALVRRRSF